MSVPRKMKTVGYAIKEEKDLSAVLGALVAYRFTFSAIPTTLEEDGELDAWLVVIQAQFAEMAEQILDHLSISYTKGPIMSKGLDS